METSAPKVNLNLPAVKRILQEARELELDKSPDYRASPLGDNNLFEWHFSIRGPPGTAFEGGIFHGRLLLPPEYPMKAPTIMLLTPNGRFEVRKKICLSITDFHEEMWQPAWGIRTALVALIAFFPTPADGAIGALDYTEAERKALARDSLRWCCEACGARMASVFRDSSAGVRARALDRPSAPATAGEAAPEAAVASAHVTQGPTAAPADAVEAAAPAAALAGGETTTRAQRGRASAGQHTPGRPPAGPSVPTPAHREAAAATAATNVDAILAHLAVGLVMALAGLLLAKILRM